MAFISDPNFPRAMLNCSEIDRIRLCQSLNSQYSNREFTKVTDRPMAISGLEKRLIRSLDTSGGYGIFHRYFGRSLLWQRDKSDLNKISELCSMIPSWSWMAYEGGIKYMDIPFKQVQWNKTVISPFAAALNDSSNRWYTGDPNYARIPVRVFLLAATFRDKGSLVLDHSSNASIEGLRCVVIGTRKNLWYYLNIHQEHYVLLVRRIDGPGDTAPKYERVGVGTLETKDIDFKSGEAADIC